MFAKDGVELESTEWLAAAVDDEKRIISLLLSRWIMDIRGVLKEKDRSAKFSSSFDTSSLSKSALDCGSCKVPVYIYELSCM